MIRATNQIKNNCKIVAIICKDTKLNIYCGRYVTVGDKKKKIGMDYLKHNELKGDIIVDYKGEKYLLHEKVDIDRSMTFMDKTLDKDKNYIDRKAKVFIKERWKVTILPKTKFDKKFTTIRWIESFYCIFANLDREIDGHIVWPSSPSEGLIDDFDGIF